MEHPCCVRSGPSSVDRRLDVCGFSRTLIKLEGSNGLSNMGVIISLMDVCIGFDGLGVLIIVYMFCCLKIGLLFFIILGTRSMFECMCVVIHMLHME